MRLFKRKSTWQKMTEPLNTKTVGTVAKSGLTAAGTFLGVTLASAAVSAARQRREGR